MVLSCFFDHESGLFLMISIALSELSGNYAGSEVFVSWITNAWNVLVGVWK
jgi:hypothetical protein